MSLYYFTFGLGTENKNKYVKIEAADYFAAREIMIGRFGLVWAFQYSEKEFAGQPEEYGLTEFE